MRQAPQLPISVVLVVLLLSVSLARAAAQGGESKSASPASQRIEESLPALEAKEGKELAAVVHDLREDLGVRVGRGELLDAGTRKKLAAIVRKKAKSIDHRQDPDNQIRVNMLNLAVRFGEWAEVRDDVLVTFEADPVARVPLLRAISSRTTSMSKAEAAEVIRELESKKLIGKEDRWRELARIDPERYLPELKNELAVTANREDFKFLALLIQSHNDETVLAQIIPRIRELGLHDEKPRRDFFWIDDRLFAKHLAKAAGDTLVAAMDVLQMGGGSETTAAPIILERNLINHSDKRIRLPAVIQIRKAAGGRILPLESAEELFRDRSTKESDPDVISALNESLRALQSYRKAFKRLEELERRR